MDEFKHSGFIVLRTPLLPFEEFQRLSSPSADASVSEAAVGEPRAWARSQLRKWAQRGDVQEALWLASPDFLGALSRWWWEDPHGAKGQRLEMALYRYLARMTGRATPFGAFAACSVGRIADHTCLELDSHTRYRRHTRLDMEYLCSLAEAVAGDPGLHKALIFRPNTSLHLAAGKYHHLQGDWEEDIKLYRLVVTDPTPALQLILRRANSGATVRDLASALVRLEGDPEITLEEGEEFVKRLIASQVLVPDLIPPITGSDPAGHMLRILTSSRTSAIARGLGAMVEDLRDLDRRGLGCDIREYEKIVSAATQLPGEFRPGRLIQVDVVKPAPALCLDEALASDLLHAVSVLHRLNGEPTSSYFTQFIEDFLERYGDSEVPLLEALDDEAGIGFESEDNDFTEPLISGIDFEPAEPHRSGEPREPGGPLFQRIEELRASRDTVLELDAPLIAALEASTPSPLPDSFAVMGTFFLRAEDPPGFVLQWVSGPSGANLIGRFCYADEQLTKVVRDHLRAEENLYSEGAVFAEIAHLPEGRVGNVVCRPALRRYEIPFLATSSYLPAFQFPLSDLTVSLQGGRVILRSKRLRCEVVPRLTSAHDFEGPRNLKLYKFLCLLQREGVTSDLSWKWGTAENFDFLPRVAMGNIVFSLARWRVAMEEAQRLWQVLEGERLHAVQEWRKAKSIPRFAYITELDFHLLIDFENSLSVETCLEYMRKQPETILEEMFPGPGELPVHGPEGRFVHEVVIPFVRRKRSTVSLRGETAQHSPVGRPGAGWSENIASDSEWLFAKLYCSPSHADRLLLELVNPLVKEVLTPALAEGWFFVRYGDPRWHLRLRIHGDPSILKDQVLPRLNRFSEQMMRRGTLWRLQFGTYDREVYRYGGPRAIDVAERLFQFDSELCLELLPLTSGDAGATLRWQMAFRGIDTILSGLGLTLKQKHALIEEAAAVYEENFIVNRVFKKLLAQKFRDHRRTLAAILGGHDTGLANPLPLQATASFARFSEKVQSIRTQLEGLRQAKELTGTISYLAASFVHMHLNRLFRSSHAQQEAVLYRMLARTYASKIARDKPEPEA